MMQKNQGGTKIVSAISCDEVSMSTRSLISIFAIAEIDYSHVLIILAIVEFDFSHGANVQFHRRLK